MNSSRPIALVVTFVAALSCKPAVKDRPEVGDAERFAAALCGAAETCGCEEERSLSESCEDRVLRQFRGLEDVNSDDMTFDDDCLEEMLSYFQGSQACDTGTDWGALRVLCSRASSIRAVGVSSTRLASLGGC